MLKQTKVAFPNSLLLILDPTRGDIPESLDGLIGATASCVAVGTLSEMEGETWVIFTDEKDFVQENIGNLSRMFDGIIEIPGKELSVCTVYLEVLLKAPVVNIKSRVVVWADDTIEPQKLLIGFDM